MARRTAAGLAAAALVVSASPLHAAVPDAEVGDVRAYEGATTYTGALAERAPARPGDEGAIGGGSAHGPAERSAPGSGGRGAPGSVSSPPGGGGVDEGDTPEEAGYDPLRDAPEAVAARGYFKAGGVLTVLGGLLGAGAIAMGVSDPCGPRTGNNCHEDARNRAALAMGLPAVAILAAGLAFLGLGGREKKRLKARLGLSRTGVGAAVRLHF